MVIYVFCEFIIFGGFEVEDGLCNLEVKKHPLKQRHFSGDPM